MFICSSHKSLNLAEFERLYAFPNQPDLSGDKTVLLDSGAFALSMRNQSMDKAHIESLAKYYNQHGLVRNNVHCIAADVFKNPSLSMQQYAEFIKTVSREVSISPVLQFPRKGFVDLFSARKQLIFYKKNAIVKPRLICVSNHAFDATKCHDALVRLAWLIRDIFDDVHIHVLGAGFNSLDVARWLQTDVDSIDSISYYTDAQSKMKWTLGSCSVEKSQESFSEIAMHNANVARQSATILSKVM